MVIEGRQHGGEERRTLLPLEWQRGGFSIPQRQLPSSTFVSPAIFRNEHGAHHNAFQSDRFVFDCDFNSTSALAATEETETKDDDTTAGGAMAQSM
jgi:hypothetical protein